MTTSNIIKKKSPNKMSAVVIAFQAGSVYEYLEDKSSGVSHLLEHMICRSAKDLEDEMTERGIITNASTYSDVVSFYIRGLDSEVRAIADRWVRGILDYRPREVDFEQELPIVLQEFRDAENRPDAVYTINALMHQYQMAHQLGDYRTLSSVGFADVENAFERMFSKPWGIIYCGEGESLPFNEEGIATLPRPIPSDSSGNSGEPMKMITGESSTVSCSPTGIIRGYSEKDFTMATLALECLSDGLNSPLYKKLREELKLCYGCYAYAYDFSQTEFIPIIEASCEKDKVDEVSAAIKELVTDPDTWLTEDRFRSVRNGMRIQQEMRKQEPYGPSRLITNAYWKHKSKESLMDITREECISWMKNTFNNALYEHSESLKSKLGTQDKALMEVEE